MTLDDLAPLSKRLMAADDELNQALESVQTRLNALALGVEAWLDSASDDELARGVIDVSTEKTVRVVEIQQLGYCRVGDGWALAVRTVESTRVRDNEYDWDRQSEA